MKIKNLIAALALSTSIAVSADEKSLENIQSLVSQGEYQKALTAIDETSGLFESLELQKLKALSYLQLEQYQYAELAYLSIKAQDDGVDVNNNLGLVYLRQFRLLDAISQFKGTISRFPEDPAAYKNLGDVYMYLAQATYKKGVDSVADASVLEGDFNLVSGFFESKAQVLNLGVLVAEKTELETKGLELESEEPALEIEQPEPQQKAVSFSDPAYKVHEKSIAKVLRSWAQARTDRNRDAYYSYYQTDALVQESLNSELDGDVRTLEPLVQVLANDQASVVFDEWTGPYSHRKRLFKELQLALSEEGWKITQEKVIHVYQSEA